MYKLWAYDKNAKYIKQSNGTTVLDPITDFGTKIMPDNLEVVIGVESVIDLVKQAMKSLTERQSLAASANSVAAQRKYNLIIVSGHGAPGEQGCGSGQGSDKSRDLSSNTLDLHSDWLKKLAGVMEPKGVLFLSGCNVGEGAEGGTLLQRLSQTFFPGIDCMAYTKKTENGLVTDGPCNKVAVKTEDAKYKLATSNMRLYKNGAEVQYDSHGLSLGDFGQDLHEKFAFSVFGCG